MSKFPFQAHIVTEFQGEGYKRCKTLEEAVKKITDWEVKGIKIVKRYVCTNDKKVIVTL
jgi:hypothetical protein